MQRPAIFWVLSKPLRQFSFPVQIVQEMTSYKRIINRTKYTELGFRVESFWTKTFHFFHLPDGYECGQQASIILMQKMCFVSEQHLCKKV